MKVCCLFVVTLTAWGAAKHDVVSLEQTQRVAIVEALRNLPAPRVLRPTATEEHRAAIHSQLRDLGEEGVAALVRALADTDVMLRRNALLALYDLGHGVSRTGRVPKVDIRSAMPALVAAFKDPDAYVRGWSIQAIGALDPLPLTLVPALDEMLNDPDTGVRLSACAGLGRYGAGAGQSWVNLARLASDENRDVRTCAMFVLDKIKGGVW